MRRALIPGARAISNRPESKFSFAMTLVPNVAWVTRRLFTDLIAAIHVSTAELMASTERTCPWTHRMRKDTRGPLPLAPSQMALNHIIQSDAR